MSKTIKEVEGAYNKTARLYDIMNQFYFFGKDKQFRLLLVDELNLKPGDTVLDLCCGTGLNFPLLRQKIKARGVLVGIDISLRMLQQAKVKSKGKDVNLVKADAAYLAFRNKTFDAILLTFCLKITPTYEKTIKEAARVLKPKGRIGVLGNYRLTGPLKLLEIVFSKVLSAIAKIDFEINLKEHLSKKFRIIEDEKMYGGLVRFLVGEKTN